MADMDDNADAVPYLPTANSNTEPLAWHHSFKSNYNSNTN